MVLKHRQGLGQGIQRRLSLGPASAPAYTVTIRMLYDGTGIVIDIGWTDNNATVLVNGA